MNSVDAAILGLVQGLTEFLPVSSSGHLLVAQDRLGVNAPGLHLEVSAHLGTVAAVLVYYRALFRSHVADTFRGGPGRRTVGLVVLATAMLAVVAAVHRIAPSVKAWRDDVRVVPWGFALAGTFMLVTAFVRRGSAAPSAASSAAMGLAQCVSAIVTGCSRSGSTIGTGLVLGLDPQEAARFSFLMSVPAVLAGTAKDLLEEGLPPAGDAVPLAVAFVVAFASGLVAIHAMLRIVGRGKLHWFGFYMLAAAGTVAWMLR